MAGSVPTRVASTVSRFEKPTWIFSAPSTTWKLVTMCPSLSITNPEPSARPVGSEPFWPASVDVICTTAGAAWV